MRRTSFGALVVAALLLSVSVSCSAQQSSDAPVIHHWSGRMTLIEHRDTLTIIHVRDASEVAGPPDTSVYLFTSDTTGVRLRPKMDKPLPTHLVRLLRQYVVLAKRQEEVEKNTGLALHNH
jgi:hypothetical protein